MERLISALGLAVFIGLSYAFSVNRRAVLWRPVLWGIGLKFVFALLILKTPSGLAVFKFLGDVVSRFLEFSDAGAKFVFGEKFEENFFAFKVLPTIIFFSAFISVLYHYGILQRVVKTLAWVMMKTMGTSGAESLSTAGNIFLGPTEAPLLVKPYVATMTQSELHYRCSLPLNFYLKVLDCFTRIFTMIEEFYPGMYILAQNCPRRTKLYTQFSGKCN